MDDLISRRATVEAVVYELDMIDHVPQRIFDRLTKRIKELPSIFQPRKGKWVWDEDVLDWEKEYVCSECGCHALKEDEHQVRSNFCPNCGLRMEEGDSDEFLCI